MAQKYVVGHVNLNILAIQKRSTTPPTDGDQYHLKHQCVTKKISQDEMRWRFEIAKDILCDGYAHTRGYYYGDVIGGYWLTANDADGREQLDDELGHDYADDSGR